MLFSALAISCGACMGALLRWLFNQLLNNIFPPMPLGTLFVNLTGGFLMGLASAFFVLHPGLNQNWKLSLITGFLGSFTTFSAFSGEMGALLQQGRFMLCAGAITLHVGGSIAMFFLGVAAFGCLRKILAG